MGLLYASAMVLSLIHLLPYLLSDGVPNTHKLPASNICNYPSQTTENSVNTCVLIKQAMPCQPSMPHMLCCVGRLTLNWPVSPDAEESSAMTLGCVSAASPACSFSITDTTLANAGNAYVYTTYGARLYISMVFNCNFMFNAAQVGRRMRNGALYLSAPSSATVHTWHLCGSRSMSLY